MKVLFIVDPQNDFVDKHGSLYVKGAEEAINKICELLRSEKFDRVMVSQDTHQFYHIGHSEFWKEQPESGTVIEIPGDLSKNNYEPVLCDYENKKDVIRRVYEKNSRNIRIWPHHCIEGSWGYCFPEQLVEALNVWSAQHLRPYEVYQKGKDPFCESFSLLDEMTPDFSGTTELHVCGFCKDICVYETLKAIIDNDVLPHYVHTISVIDSCSVAYGEEGEELEAKFQKVFESWRKKHQDLEIEGDGEDREMVEEAVPEGRQMPEEAPRAAAENVNFPRVERAFVRAERENIGGAMEEIPAEAPIREDPDGALGFNYGGGIAQG